MSNFNLADEIKRIKSTKPVSKRAKQHQQTVTLQKALTEAHLLRQKSASIHKVESAKIQSQESERNFLSAWRFQQQNYSFGGKSFYFPVRDIELSVKRVQIFSDIIKKRSGITISELNNIQKVDYLITSRKISKYILYQNLEASFVKNSQGENKKLIYDKILDFNYLIDCEKEKKQIPTHHYELFCKQEQKKNNLQQISELKKIRKIQEQVTDNESETQSISSTVSLKKVQILNEPTKTLKKESHLSYNKQISRQKFACQKGSCESKFSVNQYIYDQLMKFYNIYESEKDTGRKIAYLKAASAIKSHHKQIQSEKDLIKLRGIGKKIMGKVKQLLETGQIQKLEKLKQNQETLICQQLSRVWGIGSSKAKQLFYKGITSIQQLKEKQDLLNKNQKIGLKYLSDFQQRIPRQKVAKIYEFIKGRLFQLAGSENLHIIQVCGSYRRGKQTCGDIDIIITRKDGIFEPDIIINLIHKLQQQGFLTDHLQIPSKKTNDSNSSLSYMGVCVFESQVHHRIDIKYYPLSQFAFATLYFTGSDMFNRSMRLFARKKGYSLSDHSLTVVQRNQSNQKIWKGNQICLYSQKQIFQFLGLEYKTPNQRNI